MKRFVFLILFLAGVLTVPITIFAAIHGPNECCTLDHNLTDIDNPACSEGNIVTSKDCKEKTAAETRLLCQDTTNDDDALNDECWYDGNDDGDWIDPEDGPCEDFNIRGWCDIDDDGINEAGCIQSAGLSTLAVTKNWGTCCIVDAIYNVTDWVFYVLLAAIAIIFILAGFLFFAAGGDPYKVRQAQNFLLYGAIGLILALFARIIPAIIKGIVS